MCSVLTAPLYARHCWSLLESLIIQVGRAEKLVEVNTTSRAKEFTGWVFMGPKSVQVCGAPRLSIYLLSTHTVAAAAACALGKLPFSLVDGAIKSCRRAQDEPRKTTSAASALSLSLLSHHSISPQVLIFTLALIYLRFRPGYVIKWRAPPMRVGFVNKLRCMRLKCSMPAPHPPPSWWLIHRPWLYPLDICWCQLTWNRIKLNPSRNEIRSNSRHYRYLLAYL